MIEEQGQVTLEHASDVFKALREHLMEEGIQPAVNEADCFGFEYGGNQLRVNIDGNALRVRINAVSGNILYFIRESVVQHIAEHSAAAADAFCWTKGSTAAEIPPNCQALTLISTSNPVRGMRRLTCHCPDPIALTRDGMHVKLLLPPDTREALVWPSVSSSGRTVWPRGANKLHVRYYTIRAVRPESGEVDIDVVTHAGGKVSDWSKTARAGDQIGVMGPGGGIAPPVTNNLWLIGDSTALPAIARILGTLDKNATGKVICAMADPEECEAYLPRSRLAVQALTDDEFRNDFGRILNALKDAAPAHIWFGGEQQQYKDLRAFCKNLLELPSEALDLTAYWKKHQKYDASKP